MKSCFISNSTLRQKNVQEINAYKAEHVCLSVHVSVCLSFSLSLSSWLDKKPLGRLNEIWYGRYATGIFPKIVLFNFPQ
jgi:hypothetical protein